MEKLVMIAIGICLVAAGAVFFAIRHYRLMRLAALKAERDQALERDAMRLASAKLKFRNILARRDPPARGDPLSELYGVDVPTDCRAG